MIEVWACIIVLGLAVLVNDWRSGHASREIEAMSEHLLGLESRVADLERQKVASGTLED